MGEQSVDYQTADTANRMVEAWNAHDLDAVYGELSHEDYHHYTNGVLTVKSSDAARAADQPMYDVVPDYRREVDELIVSGQMATMRWRFLGTGRKGPFEVPFVSIMKIRDRRLAEAWVYFDTATFLSATGMRPADFAART